MPTPEGVLKNLVLEYLSYQKDCLFWPNDSVGIFDPVKKIYRKKSRFHRKGVPDILGLCCGKFVAIELKSKTGRLSPEQKIFIEELNIRGAISFVARSLDDVVREITELRKKTSP